MTSFRGLLLDLVGVKEPEEPLQHRGVKILQRDLGPLPELIAAGQEQQLRQWLATRVWPLGRSVNGEQLVQQVSGESLSAAPFLRYLEEKVERLLSV